MEKIDFPIVSLKYINSYKSKVRNRTPIITPHGIHKEPPQDQYFKGALFINTLRSVLDNDERWWKLIKDFFQRFKYQNIMTEDVVVFFNQQTGLNLTAMFDEYLRHAALPTLELKFDEAAGQVSYRWNASEKAFAMPIRVSQKDAWQIIKPSSEWQAMKTPLTKDQFEVATDLYYVNVSKQ
jgi:aminopeptidase N